MTTPVNKLVLAFTSRAKAQDYKGKTRDKMALEFFLGAQVASFICEGESENTKSIAALAFMISIRGYSALDLFREEKT